MSVSRYYYRGVSCQSVWVAYAIRLVWGCIREVVELGGHGGVAAGQFFHREFVGFVVGYTQIVFGRQ